MINVMIVEDEPFVRMGLRNIVDNNEIGFNVCAEASNGREALKLLSECHPDIILLDIKMPQMDGIEFLKEKKLLGDTTPVIVLSCHGEYEYVREAMKLGAKDYILKLSAKPHDLLSLLEQVRSDTGILGSINPQTSNMTKIGNYFRNACLYDEDTDRLQEISGKEYINIQTFNNYVVDMLIDRRGKIIPDLFSDHNKNLLPDDTAASLLSTFLEHNGIYFRAGDGEFILIIPKKQQSDSEVRDICRNLRNQLEFYFSATASFGIAKADTFGELYVATAKARQFSGFRFYLGPDIVVTETDLPGCEYGILPNDVIPESAMIEAVLSRDREKVKKLANDVIATIKKVQPEPSAAINHLIEMEVLILSYARKVVNPPIALSSNLLEFFNACQALDEMSEGVNQFLDVLFNNLDGKWRKSQRDEIADALSYLSEHYPENISLHDMATRYHMSTSRFCVVFKEGTGETFLDYLNQVRIRKAEELLLHSNLTIYEVADQVGFNSTNYFAKLFKRIAGKQPSEYRQYHIT
jgi:two-component system, response regulator YesN